MRGKSVLGAVVALTVVSAAAFEANSAGVANFYTVGEGIPEYLSGKPGNAEKGRATAIARKKGNCLACHKMPVPEQQFHGEVGPDLAGVGSRMTEAELRLRIVDPKITNPESMMPSFHRVEGLHRVMKKWQGKPMLSAEEVEDIVAYLKTLKEDN